MTAGVPGPPDAPANVPGAPEPPPGPQEPLEPGFLQEPRDDDEGEEDEAAKPLLERDFKAVQGSLLRHSMVHQSVRRVHAENRGHD